MPEQHAVNYVCPKCSAPLTFLPGKEEVSCEFCSSSFQVKDGNMGYMEYNAKPPADDAAHEINAVLGLAPIEAYATNDGLLAYLEEYGDLEYFEPIIIEGHFNSMRYERTIYHFTFHRYE